MPDNNFEDEVRKKMEELRFLPSGDVWTKVEENIREDRKRRRFLFWLPLTGCLLAGILWLAWPVKTSSDQAILPPKTATTPRSVTLPVAPVSADPQPVSADNSSAPGNSGSTSPGATDKSVDQPIAKKAIEENQVETPASGNRKNVNSDVDVPHRALTVTSNRTIARSPGITSEAEYLNSVSRGTELAKKRAGMHVPVKPEKSKYEEQPAEPVNETADAKTIPEPLSKRNDAAAMNKIDQDSLKQTAASANEKKNPAPPKSNSPAVVKTISKKHRMEWGFSVSGGVADQIEKNAIPPAVLNRAFLNSSVYVIEKSGLSPGPAFSAGIAVAKQISKTWRLQSGIQYAYASSRLPKSADVFYPASSYSALTAPNGGLVNFASRGNSGTHYSNRYQFIQIPVLVEKQFGSRSPVSAQAGLAFGYLSSVHAVIYQPLLDQFTPDNEKFNKFQVSGLVGAYWKFRIDQHWSLRAGPEVQYQLGNFMKSSTSVNDHLLTGSLRVILLHSAK